MRAPPVLGALEISGPETAPCHSRLGFRDCIIDGMKQIGDGPAVPHHGAAEVGIARLTARHPAAVAIDVELGAGDAAARHQAPQVLEGAAAASVRAATGVAAVLMQFRRIDSVKAHLGVAVPERVAIHDAIVRSGYRRPTPAVTGIKGGKGKDEDKGDVGEAPERRTRAPAHSDLGSSQRRAASSSLVRASTQALPVPPSSSFQNGALVLRKSMMKRAPSKAASR